MKKKILIIIGIIVAILIILGFITSYIDSARVRNSKEPKFTIKIVNDSGSKVTYWGLGYKVVRYPSVSPNEPYKNNIGVKYGSWFMKYELKDKENVTYDELNEVNNKIIDYFSTNGVDDYKNYSYNYVDENDKVVVVGLLDNSEEKQAEFKRLVVDSELIRFEKGERMVNEPLINGDNNEKATTEVIELKTEVELTNHGNSSEELVKYKVYVKNQKLYATNLKTKEEKIVFDKELVKNIAIRRICCTGDGYLLILTTNGNVYMSEKDCNYAFSFNFPFKKLEVTDIVSFKLIPAFDYDMAKNLYGVDSEGKEILLHKMN